METTQVALVAERTAHSQTIQSLTEKLLSDNMDL
jgi:hypothetical protein